MLNLTTVCDFQGVPKLHGLIDAAMPHIVKNTVATFSLLISRKLNINLTDSVLHPWLLTHLKNIVSMPLHATMCNSPSQPMEFPKQLYNDGSLEHHLTNN